jgi:hypothetical protein
MMTSRARRCTVAGITLLGSVATLALPHSASAGTSPTIMTMASPGIVLGAGSLSDSATVSGRVNPLPGTSVSFALYGPNDTTCSGDPVSTSIVSYPVDGGAVTSGSFTPTRAGTYRWIASYSGAASITSVSGACNDDNESAVVAVAPTSIATTASPGIVLGAGSLSDGATVSGRVTPVPGASVSFALYGPNDDTCSGDPVSTSIVSYAPAGGAVTSGSYPPTRAGTYRWVASYSGDANNAPVTGACSDDNESIATTASPGIMLGAGSLSDSATVSGRISPVTGASMAFAVYGPTDVTCSGDPVSTSTVSYPVDGGPVTSTEFTPTQAGTYRWVASYSGDANNAPVTGACSDDNESAVVAVATTSIATTASPSTVLGDGTITDSATVSGRISPVTGASVTFALYRPNDATCSGDPVTTSIVSYPVDGGPVTSTEFTPTQAGTYRWVASYSGDANNGPVSDECNEDNESTVVDRATTWIDTSASRDTRLGRRALTDNARVSGRVSPLPGASVSFALYGPNDTTCSGDPVSTSIVSYAPAGGAVTSGSFTPTRPGTYRWVASYSGDANNEPVGGACNDDNESTFVDVAPTWIATTASPGIVLGAGTLSDTATVYGRFNPGPGQGPGVVGFTPISASVAFALYGPNDAACSGEPVSTSTVSYPVDGGPVASTEFTPTQAGTYRWVASYSGDADNAPAKGSCNDDNESTVVDTVTTSIATTASPATTLGAGVLTDSATVSGRLNPVTGASVAFAVYGPNDAACSGDPVTTSTVSYPVDGGPVTSTEFTPTQAGTYRWVASYSGDVNNAPVSGACSDDNESAAVAVAPTSVATTASPGTVLGSGSLSDRATVSGRVSPIAGASVAFALYGPSDTTCAGPPVAASTVPYPVDGGSVVSTAFTPAQAGTYRWVASYSGDANNAAASGACSDAHESVEVVPSLRPLSGMSYDFSGDGHPDVIARSPDGLLRLYLGGGTKFTGVKVVGQGWNPFTAIFSPGDWNGDGHPDLIARTPTGALTVYYWNGSRFASSSTIGVGFNNVDALLSPGDWNGDHHPDVVGRTTDGVLHLYSGNGTTITGTSTLGTGWNSFTAILSTGDFTGDGHADLMGRTTDGMLHLYMGNGTGISGSRVIGTGWNSITAFDGSADWTGDHHADLLARAANGDLVLYRGNGVNFTSWARIGTRWNGMTALT